MSSAKSTVNMIRRCIVPICVSEYGEEFANYDAEYDTMMHAKRVCAFDVVLAIAR